MKNKSYDIHKAAGIIIVERKLLLTREKGDNYFVSPGGKIENGEASKETLIRELTEEVGISVMASDLEEFGIFFAKAAGVYSKNLRMEVFRVLTWKGVPFPNVGEEGVEEIMWVDSHVPSGVTIDSIFEHEVIPRLKKFDLID